MQKKEAESRGGRKSAAARGRSRGCLLVAASRQSRAPRLGPSCQLLSPFPPRGGARRRGHVTGRPGVRSQRLLCGNRRLFCRNHGRRHQARCGHCAGAAGHGQPPADPFHQGHVCLQLRPPHVVLQRCRDHVRALLPHDEV